MGMLTPQEKYQQFQSQVVANPSTANYRTMKVSTDTDNLFAAYNPTSVNLKVSPDGVSMDQTSKGVPEAITSANKDLVSGGTALGTLGATLVKAQGGFAHAKIDFTPSIDGKQFTATVNGTPITEQNPSTGAMVPKVYFKDDKDAIQKAQDAGVLFKNGYSDGQLTVAAAPPPSQYMASRETVQATTPDKYPLGMANDAVLKAQNISPSDLSADQQLVVRASTWQKFNELAQSDPTFIALVKSDPTKASNMLIDSIINGKDQYSQAIRDAIPASAKVVVTRTPQAPDTSMSWAVQGP